MDTFSWRSQPVQTAVSALFTFTPQCKSAAAECFVYMSGGNSAQLWYGRREPTINSGVGETKLHLHHTAKLFLQTPQKLKYVANVVLMLCLIGVLKFETVGMRMLQLNLNDARWWIQFGRGEQSAASNHRICFHFADRLVISDWRHRKGRSHREDDKSWARLAC